MPMPHTITICIVGSGSTRELALDAEQVLQSGLPVWYWGPSQSALAQLAELGVGPAGAIPPKHTPVEAARWLLGQVEHGDLVLARFGDEPAGQEMVGALLDLAEPAGVAVRMYDQAVPLDGLIGSLPIDLSDGLEVLSAADLEQRPPAGDLPALIVGMASRSDMERVASFLQTVYPGTHPVTFVEAVGVAGNFRTAGVLLSDLPSRDCSGAPASVYLPPVTERQARSHPLDPLVKVMAQLRGSNGCPWDQEQTHRSLRPYMLEEAYEAVEAIDQGDADHLRDELGDVLLQVVFHSQLASERGDFSIDHVVQSITEKLVRRHPHVFGDTQVTGSADVVRNWDAIKLREKGRDQPESILEGVGKGLPALIRANKIQKKLAKVGFDWPEVSGALAKVREEVAELEAAGPERAEEEIGDLLFAVVNVARFYGVEPENALINAIAKVSRRFLHIETEARSRDRKLEEMTLEEMDLLWEEAKNAEE